MASEVQHIIALSLNKIMASRTRRGGVSLHRNLLVASVLLRAKDAYIAETVAKRKQDMDAEAVVPNLECPEVSEEDQMSENTATDTSSISQPNNDLVENENQNYVDASNDNTEKDYNNYESDYSSNAESVTDSVEMYCDASKENYNPNVSGQYELLNRSCSRKRRYQEQDGDELEYDNSKQADDSLDADENCEPFCKHMKIDMSEQYSLINNDVSFNYAINSELSDSRYSLQNSAGQGWDYNCDNCEKQSTLSAPEEHISCTHSVCAPLSSEQTFTQQVNMAHTNFLILTI